MCYILSVEGTKGDKGDQIYSILHQPCVHGGIIEVDMEDACFCDRCQ